LGTSIDRDLVKDPRTIRARIQRPSLPLTVPGATPPSGMTQPSTTPHLPSPGGESSAGFQPAPASRLAITDRESGPKSVTVSPAARASKSLIWSTEAVTARQVRPSQYSKASSGISPV
jgi:hypothetical protein